MFKKLLEKVFSLLAPLRGNTQIKQTYTQPMFVDKRRLTKIHQVFPEIDKIYQEYANKHHFPGYCYAIIVDGELVHTRCVGYADLDKKMPVTPQTVFRIASMTKSFTAMAILQLRDAGKLKLDDPVYIYLPQIRNQQLTQDAPEITIRDLLVHSSGLPQDDPWADRKLDATVAELVSIIDNGLYFSNTSGIKFEYSNLGYSILGYIINKVSGISYQEYIAKNIWQPLGMQHAAWEYAVFTQNLAQGYKWVNDNWQKEALLHDGSFGSMGGMLVSIEDFGKYVALHQNAWPPRNDQEGDPVNRSTIRSMHRPWMFDELNIKHKLLDGCELGLTKGYGYGLRWACDTQSKVYVFHSGGLPGFGCNWNMLPDYGIAVILMTNVTYALAYEVNMQALNTLIQEAQLQPRTLMHSLLLQKRQKALIKLLPDWHGAINSGIFASNFFLDNNIESLQKKSQEMFEKMGKIVRRGEVIAENQLRGHFMLEGENSTLKIRFTLAPEQSALIQEFTIEMK